MPLPRTVREAIEPCPPPRASEFHVLARRFLELRALVIEPIYCRGDRNVQIGLESDFSEPQIPPGLSFAKADSREPRKPLAVPEAAFFFYQEMTEAPAR